MLFGRTHRIHRVERRAQLFDARGDPRLALLLLLLVGLGTRTRSLAQPRAEFGAARTQLGDRVVNVVLVRGVAAVLVARHDHAAKRGVGSGGSSSGGGLSHIAELREQQARVAAVGD